MKYLMLLVIFIMGCKQIPYVHDTGFIGSAVANSPEFLITLNGQPCKDTDGFIGFCAKRLKKDTNLVIAIQPQQFSYTFRLDCTNSINSDFATDVLKELHYAYVIEKNKFENQEVFNCTIDIIPHDRLEPIAAFAAFRIMLIDKEYVPLPAVSFDSSYIILGQHAYFTRLGSKLHKEETALKYDIEKAEVQSYNMRYSYHGY